MIRMSLKKDYRKSLIFTGVFIGLSAMAWSLVGQKEQSLMATTAFFHHQSKEIQPTSDQLRVAALREIGKTVDSPSVFTNINLATSKIRYVTVLKPKKAGTIQSASVVNASSITVATTNSSDRVKSEEPIMFDDSDLVKKMASNLQDQKEPVVQVANNSKPFDFQIPK